jgi:hypothetical protein
MLTARKCIGLAVTEQGIAAVEVGMVGGRRGILHVAELPFAPGVSLGQPDALGKELRQMLRQNGFQASPCVIGLPATWLAAREKSFPAADAQALRGVLSIAAEREFASGAQDLTLDYLQWPSGKGVSALLVAAPRVGVDQLLTAARAAGLSVTAVTSSAVALATATVGEIPAAGRLVLCLSPRGAELTVQWPDGVRLVRHLPARLGQAGAPITGLAGDLRRILAAVPTETGAEGRQLLIWDAVGLERPALTALGEGLGLSWQPCGLAKDLEAAPAAGAAVSDAFAPAAALACLGGGEPLSLDFLHSRLAAAKPPRVARWVMGAIAAGVVLLALVAYLVLDGRSAQQDVADLAVKVAQSAAAKKDAQELVDRVAFTGAWYDHRPRFLDCDLEITGAFPQQGSVWATSLTIREDMQAQLAGKAISEEAILGVLDRLKSNPKLGNVKPLFIRQAGGTSREVSFSVSLSLRGAN